MTTPSVLIIDIVVCRRNLYSETPLLRVYRVVVTIPQFPHHYEWSEFGRFFRKSTWRVPTSSLAQSLPISAPRDIETYLHLPQRGGYLHLPQCRVYLYLPQRRVYQHLPQRSVYLHLPQRRVYLHLPQRRVYLHLLQRRVFLHPPQRYCHHHEQSFIR